MKLAVYDDAGHIRKCVTNRSVEQQRAIDTDLNVAEVADDINSQTHYINPETGRANRRDTTPCTPSATTVVADGVAEITLSQMRDGTTIQITGPGEVETTVTGDNARETIRFTSPGTYTIIATAPFPALPKEIVIHAS